MNLQDTDYDEIINKLNWGKIILIDWIYKKKNNILVESHLIGIQMSVIGFQGVI